MVKDNTGDAVPADEKHLQYHASWMRSRLDLRTAYLWLCFLGFTGAHQKYLGNDEAAQRYRTLFLPTQVAVCLFAGVYATMFLAPQIGETIFYNRVIGVFFALTLVIGLLCLIPLSCMLACDFVELPKLVSQINLMNQRRLFSRHEDTITGPANLEAEVREQPREQ